MKKHTTYILAAFSIFAAMSVVSCEKETYTPVQTKQEPVTTPEKKETVYNLGYYQMPVDLTEGKEQTVTVIVHTNIPGEELAFESDSWISGSYKRKSSTQGIIEVDIRVTANTDQHRREGKLLIKDSKGRVQPVTVPVGQSFIVVNKEGTVQFKDKAFKTAMLELYDKDGDGDVSKDEALEAQTIELVNKGIKDISGIEDFQNVWMIDLRDNDIEDATLIKDHPYLHWLSLKGNKHLKTFDVRGCSSYFEVCDFEVTDDLDYYLYYRTMGVTWPDDKYCRHSHHSRDPRLTEDWSREGECYQVYKHTKGPGKLAIVVSGIGWIDVDVKYGTFERIVHEYIELLKDAPTWKENWEYLDVYVYIHMAEKRCQWMYWNEELEEAIQNGYHTPENIAKKEAYNQHRKALWENMEKAVDNKYCYKITVDSHSNMICNAVCDVTFEWCHIVPINQYDKREERYYNYTQLKDVLMNEFPIGEDKVSTWTDWKDFD